MVLWLLMEHVYKPVGHLCKRSACTHFPRATCAATHANPVELPECSNNGSAYIYGIIKGCRLQDPRSRISTHQLADALSSTPQPNITSAEIQEVLMPYINSGSDFSVNVYFDYCCDVTTAEYHHCNICDSGDYDICSDCYNKGCRCFVPEHRLMKMAIVKNDVINVPE